MIAQALPWHARFDGILEPSKVRSLITIPASRLYNLDRLPTETARVQLERAFSEFYIPTDSAVQILCELVQRAYAHSLTYYPSTAGYLAGVYAPESPLEVGQITCLTGPAGVGKTRAIRCLMSMLGGLQRIRVDAGHDRAPLLTALYCAQGSKTSTREMLHELSILAGAGSQTKNSSEGKLIQLLRQLVFVSGICMLFYDEAQLKTLSAAANTAMTHLLLQLRSIGIPVVAVLNYSMINRLCKRNHEDRDRLLADNLVMNPPAFDSACCHALLGEYGKVVPGMFSFELSDHAKLIDAMTALLPRSISSLLSLSYVVAQAERSSSINIAHVRKAYQSRRYAAHRGDVEVIQRQRANPQKVVRVDGKPRWDLFCPFQAADVDAQHVQAAKDARQENVASRRLSESFSPAEKKLVQSAVTSVGATVDSLQKCERAKSVPRPKTGKELLSNEACVMDLMRKRGGFER